MRKRKEEMAGGVILWGIPAGGKCQYRILPGNGSGEERKILASLPVGRQMDLNNSTFFPSAIPYHHPLSVTELESILIPDSRNLTLFHIQVLSHGLMGEGVQKL